MDGTGLSENPEEEILIKQELTSDDLFSLFVSQGEDFLEILDIFHQLCASLSINPKNYKTTYQNLTSRLTSWKCKNLWNKIDKKAKHQDYKNKPCAKLKTVVIGAGPCGLRTAIELALLGAEVILVEKRNSFSRNNVLHLWPFLIVDLKNLGAKVFYGKFCAGSLDHISIRKLQCILLKVCLVLGVQIYPETTFQEMVEPSEGRGWRIKTSPSHPDIWNADIDAIVGADGKRNTLKGFTMKEFRGKLAIGITVNFVNKNSQQEAAMEEISGVAFIYNQQFFQELKDKTGIDLENIVYYKDDTHYFVMTAKKKSLLEKGVIMTDNADARKLLSPSNVDHDSLLQYAREAVDFSTHYELPHHEFAINHYGKEDVAMFDFTSMHAAENASRIVERKGRRILMCIVGDTLIEPFWPTGSGCARGFLSAFDAAWEVRSLGLGREPLDIIQERESILRLLAQTKPGNMNRDYQKYSIDPLTRYLNCNPKSLKKHVIKHLFDKSDVPFRGIDYETPKEERAVSSPKPGDKGTGIDAYRLLKWCQEQTKEYPGVKVVDMAVSWKNGLGFCAIIHRFRPDIIDFFSLDENDAENNCQLAFDVAEEHLGIPPKMSGKDFTSTAVPDRLTVISYLSFYYETFKSETPALVGKNNNMKEKSPGSPRKSPLKANKMSIVARLSRRSKKKSKKTESKFKGKNKENIVDDKVQLKKYAKKDNYATDKQQLITSDSEPCSSPEPKPELPAKKTPLATLQTSNVEATPSAKPGVTFAVVGAQSEESQTDERGPSQSKRTSKISMLAESVFGVPTKQAVAEAETTLSESELCWFCKRRVYVVERMSAEGMFFHRQCFRCNVCKCNLLLGNYAFEAEEGQTGGKFYCKPHFNKIIYNTPREAEKQPERVKSPSRSRKTRPATQVIEPTPIHKAFPMTLKEEDSPESERERSQSVINVKIPDESPETINENRSSPYNKFEARTLVRHPSLTRQQSKSLSPAREFLTPSASKLHHAASTPALQKLFNEDNEFGEDLRKRAELKDNSGERRRHLRKLKPSLELQKSIEKDLERDDHFTPGRPSTPETQRRKPLPVKLDLGSLLNDDEESRSGLKKVSVDIDIDGDSNKTKDKQKMPGKAKKKKYVLKRKKEKKAVSETIVEERGIVSSPDLDRAVSPTIEEARIDVEGNSYPEPSSIEFDAVGDARVSDAASNYAAAAGANVTADASNADTTATNTTNVAATTIDTTAADSTVTAATTTDITGGDDTHPTATADATAVDTSAMGGTDFGETEIKAKDSKQLVKKKKKLKIKKEKKDKEKKKQKKEKKKDEVEEDPDWVMIDIKGEEIKNEIARTDDSGSSDQEDFKPKPDGFISRVLGTKPKRVLKTAEEIEEEERKQKRKELKKIQQAANERRLKRLWEAQSIQRKLNEVEVKQVELDEQAKALEKKLRRPYLKPEEEGPLMLDWFQLVNDKNVLLRFESELIIQANNIQLEDQQARLEADIRALLTSDDPKVDDQEWIQVLTKELVDTVEQRNNLVEMLEEDRIRELEEDKNLQELMASKAKELGMDRLI